MLKFINIDEVISFLKNCNVRCSQPTETETIYNFHNKNDKKMKTKNFKRLIKNLYENF